MKKCIILANGQTPGKSIFDFLETAGYNTLICADGGANIALKYDIIPDYIIGDMDSIDTKTYDYYYDKCEIIQIKRQNDTDVEKCLKYAIKNKFTEAVLLGATGDRLDHSFCNLGIVIKFFGKINLKVIHQKSVLKVYEGTVKLSTKKNEIISIYGFDEKTKITSSGLKYPLKNISLPLGKRESTSNKAKGEEVILKIKGGKIFVIREFKIMKKYGLI